jgi:hypothetical protein
MILLNRAPTEKINLALEQIRQLMFHPKMAKQAPISFWCKCHQDVQITICVKIIAYDRPEQSKLIDQPTPTKINKQILGYVNF